MKGRFKSSPNLNDVQAALPPRDDVSDEASPRHLSDRSSDDAHPVRPVPRPESAHAHLLRARDSDDDATTPQAAKPVPLIMTQPPSVARVTPIRPAPPLNNVAHDDVTAERHDSSDEQNAVDVDEIVDDEPVARPPREISRSNAPSSLFGDSPRDVTTPQSNGAVSGVSNTAFLRKIYEANVGSATPAALRTVSEINDVIKSQQVKAPSPWHSRSTSGASSIAGADPATSGSLSARELTSRAAEESPKTPVASLARSASSNSLDETPVKEERRSRVEMSQIRLSSPAPTTPTTSAAVATTSTETWRQRGSVGGDARSVLRRREGEPEDEKQRASRLFTSSVYPPATTADAAPTVSLTATSSYRPYSRPRSSVDGAMATGANENTSVRPEQTEVRGRVGTLLSRNKEILTNLLPTHRSAVEMTSSPQVPRRSRSGSSSGSGGANPTPSLGSKLQWLKPSLPNKHPLDVTSPTSSQPPAVSALSNVTISVAPSSPAVTTSPSSQPIATTTLSPRSSLTASDVTACSPESVKPPVTLPRGSLGSSERSAFRSPRSSLSPLDEKRASK